METITTLLAEALSLCQAGHLEEGQQKYLEILKLDPVNTKALSNLASIAMHHGNLDKAIALFKKSLAIQSDQPIPYYNYGMALQKAKQLEQALTAYDVAIRLNPSFVQAYNNRGLTHSELKLHEDALADFNQAIQINPEYAEAYNNRGLTHSELKRHEEAMIDYNRAIQLNLNYAEAYNNRAITLSELKRHEEAMTDCNQAIQLNPNYAEAFNNRALTYSKLNRHEEAMIDYNRAFQLNPEIDYLLGLLLREKMKLCHWDDLDYLINKLKNGVENQQKCTSPFILGSLIDNPKLHKKNTEIYIKENFPLGAILPKIEKNKKNKKIKIGYLSADFHNHATMHLMAEIFEHHDKSQFELIALSFGPETKDIWRERAKSCFNQFIDVSNKSDIEIALLSRELAIDIAVDLKGFTRDSRTDIFAHRAAPIQVNYLGFPGTMGADYIDYIIADGVIIPEENKHYYSEKIIYLPHSYQANMRNRSMSDKTFTRKEMGLPDDSFVFCSFNNNYKITPATFDCWMRILQTVENSVLWLFQTNETAINNLKKEAESRGVNSDRLVFASRLPVEEHFKRIQLADLFLDTSPYNAHTTASDALRVGLPILTLIGSAFASRVAASLLKTVNLTELIATNPNEYESIAINIAKNPQKLQQLKSKLKDNVTTSTLYNSSLFTQHIEQAFLAIYDRLEGNLLPEHIYIKNTRLKE